MHPEPFDSSDDGRVALSLLVGDLRITDIARISGVSQSTLSRLWNDPLWLDHVGGTTLTRLIAISPQINRYVRLFGERQRLSSALAATSSMGVSVKPSALTELLSVSPVSSVVAMLSAVVSTLHGNYADASRMFSVGWAEDSNEMIDALFATGPNALLEDAQPFLDAATRLADYPIPLVTQSEIVGYGIIQHKIIKTGVSRDNELKEELAFLERSRIVGHLLSGDDLSLVDRYRERVSASRELRVNEIWSHATYARDLPLPYRGLPKQIRLPSVAKMAASDIDQRNDAYVYYLLTVALPVLLRADPFLGGGKGPVVEAVHRAADRPNRQIKIAAVNLLRELAS